MSTPQMPSPELVMDMLFAYRKSAALKAAIDLDVFTAIDEGAQTASAIAARTQASARGIRILCDFLTIEHLLDKAGDHYALAPESVAFLSKRSPAYLGATARFLSNPEVRRNFDNLTDAVRRGGAAVTASTVSNENPLWVEFARSMAPMMLPSAHAIADLLQVAGAGPMKVLDLAAGHGTFGITIAQRNPLAEIVAIDWQPVLEVAAENAHAAGVDGRYRLLGGDAFSVEFGRNFDIALITNFLHHFDAPTCVALLKRVYEALKPGGRVVVLEYVPNTDRISPTAPASFSLTMLAGTPSGDAYTLPELRDQLEAAGFQKVVAHPTPTPQTVLIAHKGAASAG